jgi:hypothetical protein
LFCGRFRGTRRPDAAGDVPGAGDPDDAEGGDNGASESIDLNLVEPEKVRRSLDPFKEHSQRGPHLV